MHEWAARVAQDWPALEVRARDGWRLGFSEGVTRRANSALRLAPAAPVEAAEAFYRERGQAPVFQIWPGDEDLDRELARRGYRAERPATVMAREIGAPDAAGPLCPVLSRPDERWRALWAHGGVDGHAAAVQHRIMRGVASMGYAVDESGQARGCAALNGEWVGLYNMFTAESARGRGLAGRVLEALLAWGRDGGALWAYLLVEEANTAALRAYTRAGFSAVSRYHYRAAGPGAPQGADHRTQNGGGPTGPPP